MRVRHHPYCTIIPPHILEEVAKRGTQQQKDWALNNLTLAGFLRGQRHVAPTLRMAAAAGFKNRVVFDNQNEGGDPPRGRQARIETSPDSPDATVNEAFNGAGATYDLYFDVFQRNSVDDKGLTLVSYVHFATDFNNAFWDGSQMIYGDGDNQIFGRFTKCIDVIGHELTHGVTQYEANLTYSGQSGALNESFSDVFGSLVKQRSLGQTAETADWLIGEGLFTPSIKGVALRSMKEPGTAYDDPVLGKDPQPGHMNDYVNTFSDNGGVHINSGIPNRAFFLTATALGGNAWDKAGKIWYVALRDRMRSNYNFKRAARATVSVAKELFGDTSTEMKAVQDAWRAVGVL
ncbi:M4 family metallopeptidase [Geomonas sp. RF6]|uniref:M4 family metallopeptidase n=1 Tax=Geomonas sp. RF6 TaxID=2897342 RepID=UPI001E3A5ABD|nr:M4 family metallopeptidase [Geomonas sp. RF6]UFS72588.1 M4 family metallopeptidase [Geomonas sp. RF6]